ncbi:ATP-dependent nuclease [Paenibacillus sp. NPDC093718]|uniref:ATP-dependent nuclease n=1 Tax=Paenibacillus sp. NPDC093718 TaxID=3390601 RepID=UPI003D0311D7
MYLKCIRLWNFRKYGTKGDNSELPGLSIELNKNFNLIIGENDAGKSAIIDAIKLTLGTSSDDNHKIMDSDFHIQSNGKVADDLKIECIFSELNEQEAGLFLEWLSFDQLGNYELQVRLIAKKHFDQILGERIERNIKAGPENASNRLEGITRDLIRATYLKPLRDAENELKPGFRSRLAQILKNHEAFKKNNPLDNHELEVVFSEANEKIEEFFNKPFKKDKTIKSELEGYLDQFFHKSIDEENEYNPDFKIAQVKLNEILKKLSLILNDTPSGLGSLNLLFIATELLLYNNETSIGANVTLIEEVEAHLHPQAQLRLIKYLQSRNEEKLSGQFILTTHSTTLTASTQLEHVILLNNSFAYPMGVRHTKLDTDDYKFLERFLDSTKANLFFAKGVIFVEGDAENLLLPVIADILDRPLHRHGVTIVNVGNTAFKRYAKIYGRSVTWLENNPPLNVPVSIVTDVDVRPVQYYDDNKEIDSTVYIIQNEEQLVHIAETLDISSDEIKGTMNTVFLSKTELKGALELYSKTTSSNLEYILNFIKTDITPEIIVSLRNKKKHSIRSEYEDLHSNIKTFIAPNWTLEYEIALSQLWPTLIKSIHNVKYKKPDSEVNKNKFDGLKTSYSILQDSSDRAYRIYKPLSEKHISKAAVAQELAHLLSENKQNLSDIVLNDPFLEYLRAAIYHATGGTR